MTGAPRLFVPGYYSGFSNNKMSLDIAIVLAHLTGRVLAPYRFRLPRRHLVDGDPDQVVAPMVVPELFDIPVPWTDEHLLSTWISEPDAALREWEPVYESVVCVDDVPAGGDDRFAEFRNGRRHVYVVGRTLEEGRDLQITTQGLGNYSTTFFLDDQQRRDVVALMRRVRPKQPYVDAAALIGAGLGPYNAIHIRRGDFVANELARRRISRAATINGREIVSNLATRMARDDPLVICTDGDAGEEIFGPIQQHFRHTVFLDRHLRGDPASRDAVAGLPRGGEAVDALVAQLVAAGARTFAGTLFSTFTGLIHRTRGFTDPTADVLYCYDDFLSPLVRFERCEFLPVDDGPFSWNRVRYPVSPDAYSWLREWPEAWEGRATSSACPAGEAHPVETLDLAADAANAGGADDPVRRRRRWAAGAHRLDRSGRPRLVGRAGARRRHVRGRDQVRLPGRIGRQRVHGRAATRPAAGRHRARHRRVDDILAVASAGPARRRRRAWHPVGASARPRRVRGHEPQRAAAAARGLNRPESPRLLSLLAHPMGATAGWNAIRCPGGTGAVAPRS